MGLGVGGGWEWEEGGVGRMTHSWQVFINGLQLSTSDGTC